MALGQAVSRDHRRRRVLQDEARRQAEYDLPPATEGARYTDAASVENHPQITQFIPRRYRTYALGLVGAGGSIGVIEALHLGGEELAAAIGSKPIAAFDLASGGGIAAWFSSLMLVAVAATAWMIFSLRRHRVDDYKARYRLWAWITGAAILASLDSVAHLHQPWSSLWVSLTGWSMAGGAIWWLAPAGLVGIWLSVRLVAETAECRGACSLILISIAAYAIALLVAVGGMPVIGPVGRTVAVSSSVLIGHTVTLAGVMLYARYVVLDVQGLIAHEEIPHQKDVPATASPSRKAQEPPATLPLQQCEIAHSDASTSKAKKQVRSQEAGHDDWVDGSEPHVDPYEEPPQQGRKPDKAGRKRLRKQKRRCA